MFQFSLDQITLSFTHSGSYFKQLFQQASQLYLAFFSLKLISFWAYQGVSSCFEDNGTDLDHKRFLLVTRVFTTFLKLKIIYQFQKEGFEDILSQTDGKIIPYICFGILLIIIITKMSTNLTDQTYLERQSMKQNFFMRMVFKAYFPSQKFHHLHQTTEHLLSKIFCSENYLNKISTHLFIDDKLASQALKFRVNKLLLNLQNGNYSNNSDLKAIQSALVFSDREGIKEIPYFLK